MNFYLVSIAQVTIKQLPISKKQYSLDLCVVQSQHSQKIKAANQGYSKMMIPLIQQSLEVVLQAGETARKQLVHQVKRNLHQIVEVGLAKKLEK